MAPSRIAPAAPSNESLHDDAGPDSALCALTDFRQHNPITVEIDCRIEDALAEMSRWGVNALLVTRQELAAVDLQVVGLITFYDIECRRRFSQKIPGEHNGIVRVGEVMTAWDELALVKYESLRSLPTSNLHEIFQGTGLTHLLVVEFRDDDSVVARGLLSRSAIDHLQDRPPLAPAG